MGLTNITLIFLLTVGFQNLQADLRSPQLEPSEANIEKLVHALEDNHSHKREAAAKELVTLRNDPATSKTVISVLEKHSTKSHSPQKEQIEKILAGCKISSEEIREGILKQIRAALKDRYIKLEDEISTSLNEIRKDCDVVKKKGQYCFKLMQGALKQTFGEKVVEFGKEGPTGFTVYVNRDGKHVAIPIEFNLSTSFFQEVEPNHLPSKLSIHLPGCPRGRFINIEAPKIGLRTDQGYMNAHILMGSRLGTEATSELRADTKTKTQTLRILSGPSYGDRKLSIIENWREPKS